MTLGLLGSVLQNGKVIQRGDFEVSFKEISHVSMQILVLLTRQQGSQAINL